MVNGQEQLQQHEIEAKMIPRGWKQAYIGISGKHNIYWWHPDHWPPTGQQWWTQHQAIAYQNKLERSKK